MARAMFDYTIDVLQRVSFNLELFSKELKKAVKTKGLNYTNAARSAVEASGGSIED